MRMGYPPFVCDPGWVVSLVVVEDMVGGADDKNICVFSLAVRAQRAQTCWRATNQVYGLVRPQPASCFAHSGVPPLGRNTEAIGEQPHPYTGPSEQLRLCWRLELAMSLYTKLENT